MSDIFFEDEEPAKPFTLKPGVYMFDDEGNRLGPNGKKLYPSPGISNPHPEMVFNIDQVTVIAKSKSLKAEWCYELPGPHKPYTPLGLIVAPSEEDMTKFIGPYEHDPAYYMELAKPPSREDIIKETITEAIDRIMAYPDHSPKAIAVLRKMLKDFK